MFYLIKSNLYGKSQLEFIIINILLLKMNNQLLCLDHDSKKSYYNEITD